MGKNSSFSKLTQSQDKEMSSSSRTPIIQSNPFSGWSNRAKFNLQYNLAVKTLTNDIALIMNKTTYDEFTLQLDLIADYIASIRNLPKTKRRKATCKFTYLQRGLDKTHKNKDFVYFSVLNSGPAGETLAAQPIVAQKEMKQLFEDEGDVKLRICTIDFYDDRSVIDFRGRNSIEHKRVTYYQRTI
jgi:hypothetical protein